MACSPVGLISSMDRAFLLVIAMIRVRYPVTVADPDSEIRGGGGSSKKSFPKNNGPPRGPSLKSATVSSLIFFRVLFQLLWYLVLRSFSISFNLQCLLSLLQCHGCDELETEDMIYYKGKLHPLLSDHPDISEAWKAWDEIIFLSQKETNNDILQTSISSENKRDTFLHKGGVETRAEKDFADTMAAGCKTQRAGINDSSKGECDSTSTKETEFDSNSTENVADTVATEHKTQDGDMSILEWLKRRECGEGVIGVFEAIYCQTVAAAPSQMGLLESSREENAWDYGSGNYRLVRLLVDCDRTGGSQVAIDLRNLGGLGQSDISKILGRSDSLPSIIQRYRAVSEDFSVPSLVLACKIQMVAKRKYTHATIKLSNLYSLIIMI